MGLYVTTAQNVMLFSSKEIVSKLETEDMLEMAKSHDLYLTTNTIGDDQQPVVLFYAENPKCEHIYADEVFEFEVPKTIPNEELEERVRGFLDILPESFGLFKKSESEEPVYELTRAAVRTSVFS